MTEEDVELMSMPLPDESARLVLLIAVTDPSEEEETMSEWLDSSIDLGDPERELKRVLGDASDRGDLGDFGFLFCLASITGFQLPVTLFVW